MQGDESTYRRGVRLLSLGFLGVFGGFQAAQGLQTSLNATLGELNLGCLYGTFSVLCLVAPPVISRLERWMGIQGLLLLCASAYAAMALSNLLAVPAEPSALWAVPVALNVLVGVAAPLLWTAQNAYVGRSACQAAELLGEPREEWTTRYNSLFFSIYQFAGMLGTVVASTMLLSLGTVAWAKQALFLTLGIFCLIGALTFLLMPSVQGAEDKHPGLLDTARLMADARVGLMIPLLLANGMTIASFLGDFQTDVTCRVCGASWVGYIIACFYGINALAAGSWGQLITGKRLTRRTSFLVSGLFLCGFLLLRMLYPWPKNFARPADSTQWQRLQEPRALDVVLVFLLAAVFAVGDAFFESGPAMTLQGFFARGSLVPAMANYKLWQSVGFAVQFFLAIPLKEEPQLRGAILLSLTLISMTCIVVLDRCVASVDETCGEQEALDAS